MCNSINYFGIKIITKIITTLLITLFVINSSFALEETSNINWEKYSVSKVYSKSSKKLTFLVQFKVNSEPSLNYKYFIKILTSERKRTCDGNFIYTKGAIYTICSVKIDDIKTLYEKINIHFEVENQDNYDTEIEFYKNNNVLKNVSNFDYILGVEDEIKIINNKSNILDLDVLDTEKKIITELKKQGKTVIGYVNIGAIENYRDDYKDFPDSVIGKTYPNWEDERFLDIRNYEKFQDLILKD
ncbi:MAG: endo alpha-1,4 polygalactosaminidase [Candidatus Gracilibacteria bacterium]|nr:endo alpha-1,4 polygalactosaminidase [Candidatus Gracilibacteria bacterium]